jgi:hypothetical protein
VSVLKSSCPVSQPSATDAASPQLDKPVRPIALSVSPPNSNQDPRTGDTHGSHSPELRSHGVPQVWVISTLVAGLAVGGTAAGLGLWNQGRYGQWKERNRNLGMGLAPGETPSAWLVRQQDNNRQLASIQSTDRNVIALGIGAGALLATSAVLSFVFRDTELQPQSDKKSGRWWVQPSVSIGPECASLSLQNAF